MGWQPKKTCDMCMSFNICAEKRDAEKCQSFCRVIPMPPIMKAPDVEAKKEEYCLCASCNHSGICKYKSNFIEYQQEHFPAKIDCYKYEKKHLVENSIFEQAEKEN